VTTVAVLAGPAGLGYWFAATAAGWALLKAAAAVVGGVLVLLLVLALLGRRCPGVRIHCGGCSE